MSGRINSWLLLLAVVLAAVFPALTHGEEIKSPDGHILMQVGVQDLPGAKGALVYSVSYTGTAVLNDSRLGLQLRDVALDEHFSVLQQRAQSHDSTWKPVCGERSTVRDHYNELVLSLQHQESQVKLDLVVRVYDQGVAFCYTVPKQDTLPGPSVAIQSEQTQFAFTGDHTAWAIYTAQRPYDTAATPLSKMGPGAERPLTIRVKDDVFVALAEAKNIDFARMKLQPCRDMPFALQAALDTARDQPAAVADLPLTTPWRVIMLASSPGELLQRNDLILNLNDPCAIADTGWIKPGKVLREISLTTVGAKGCVDACVARGLQYIEFDAGWYGPENNPASDARAVHLDPKRNPVPDSLNLQEVIDYAKSKNIGVILYVNHLAAEKQLDEILPLYERWGVSGIKLGFVNVGAQRWTRWVNMAIRKAAEHRLMVDVHDEYRDTGYRRTYPNLMTVEGVRGNEEFPNPAHNAALPFTRYLSGPADYTFCWYDERLKVTHAHQLALSTIFFSPWQFVHWYDRPERLDNDPALDYWKDLPTTWDDTRILRGEIGKEAVVARRQGKTWYVGAIHTTRGVIDIPLTFLERDQSYEATIYSDRDPDDSASRAVKVQRLTCDAATTLRADTPANGGVAVRIAPIGP